MAQHVYGSVRQDNDCFYFIIRDSKGTVLRGGLYQRRKWDKRNPDMPFALVAEFTARWRPSGWTVVLTKTESGAGGSIRQSEKRLLVPRIRNCIENSGHDIVELIGEDRKKL